MASGQLTCCLLSCSPGGQVSLAVGLAPEVMSLSLLRCRCCLAGLGVAYGGRPQLLVGGCVVWDCRRIGGPEGHFFPAGNWVVTVHLLLLAESPCWPVEAGCWWVGNMTCHLQRGGEHLTSGLSLWLSLPLCFSNLLHGLPRSLHRQWGGEARLRKWTDVVELKCPL